MIYKLEPVYKTFKYNVWHRGPVNVDDPNKYGWITRDARKKTRQYVIYRPAGSHPDYPEGEYYHL